MRIDNTKILDIESKWEVRLMFCIIIWKKVYEIIDINIRDDLLNVLVFILVKRYNTTRIMIYIGTPSAGPTGICIDQRNITIHKPKAGKYFSISIEVINFYKSN